VGGGGGGPSKVHSSGRGKNIVEFTKNNCGSKGGWREYSKNPRGGGFSGGNNIDYVSLKKNQDAGGWGTPPAQPGEKKAFRLYQGDTPNKEKKNRGTSGNATPQPGGRRRRKPSKEIFTHEATKEGSLESEILQHRKVEREYRRWGFRAPKSCREENKRDVHKIVGEKTWRWGRRGTSRNSGPVPQVWGGHNKRPPTVKKKDSPADGFVDRKKTDLGASNPQAPPK